MIFFTSDWHLGISDFSNIGRDFSNADQMAQSIAQLYDQDITDQDTVFFLGDMIYDYNWPWQEFLSQRPGRKILIRGNYDRAISDAEFSPYFENIVAEGEGIELDMIMANGDKLPLWLTHYPTCSRVDRFNLVGHIHSRWQVQKNMLNVGLDVHMLRPVSQSRVEFFYDSICNWCDDDVWVSDHPANLSHNKRGKSGSYYPK